MSAPLPAGNDQRLSGGLLEIREMDAQEVKKCPSPGAGVVSVEGHALQKNQHPQNVTVTGSRHSLLMLFSVAKLPDLLLHMVHDPLRQQRDGPALVIQSAFKCLVSANQGVQSLPRVPRPRRPA